jgi:hypothetical protein
LSTLSDHLSLREQETVKEELSFLEFEKKKNHEPGFKEKSVLSLCLFLSGFLGNIFFMPLGLYSLLRGLQAGGLVSGRHTVSYAQIHSWEGQCSILSRAD